MNATAQITTNQITVKKDGEILIVQVPNGWDDTKNLVGKVLRFENKSFTYTGWNSDRNEAYFKQSNSIATILKS